MLTFPRQIAVFPSADIQRKQKTEEASYENDQEIGKLRVDINREAINKINPSVFIVAFNVVLRTLSNHPAMTEEHGWL